MPGNEQFKTIEKTAMKVLVANNYYYLRGGCERVMFNDMDALSAEGVEVIPFSAADDANVSTPYSTFFPRGAAIGSASLIGRITAAADAVSCRRTADAFNKLVDQTKPDILHCHNIYGRLSTS